MVTRVYKKTIEGQEKAERLLARQKRRENKLTVDNYMNFNLQLGQGTDNALSNSTYGFNPITRYRVLLEWIHRGSWLGGVAIDVSAEDSVRGGIEIHSLSPKDTARLQNALVAKGIWKSYARLKKWGKLYGGAIGVYLIDGQRLDTPLDIDTVGTGQFKGLAVLDRWQVQPTLNQDGLVEAYGPDLGMPKYYIVNNDAPMLRGQKIHYTRVIRHIGVELPFYQAILEQFWGISVLERLYDRLVAFDSATSGIAQYIHKMHIRVIKIDKYRQIQAGGGKMLQGFIRFMEDMRRRQSNEGITIIDSTDEYVTFNSNISSGISEALLQLGQQLAGALQMPLVRLFGQSPGGLGSNGDSELRTYYEGVAQGQERDDRVPITNICILTARSENIKIKPDEFGFNFRSLYQLSDEEKSGVFDRDTRAILEAYSTGVITKAVALLELRQLGRYTNRWTNITDEEIKEAENEPPQAALEDLTPKLSKLEKVNAPQQVKQSPKQLSAPSGADKPKKSKDSFDISRALVSMKRITQIIRDETPMITLFGLPVVIECNKGEKRWEDGPDWPCRYGFICNALATDGDELDCFVGDDLTATEAYVLNHNDGEGDFEELKVMLGFNSIKDALRVYEESYGRRAGNYSLTIALKDFAHWQARADLTKPIVPLLNNRGTAIDVWEEGKHPRNPQGEFSESGGGSAKKLRGAFPEGARGEHYAMQLSESEPYIFSAVERAERLDKVQAALEADENTDKLRSLMEFATQDIDFLAKKLDLNKEQTTPVEIALKDAFDISRDLTGAFDRKDAEEFKSLLPRFKTFLEEAAHARIELARKRLAPKAFENWAENHEFKSVRGFANDKQFVEAEHPRNKEGEFTEKGSSGTSKAKTKKSKSVTKKTEKPAAPPKKKAPLKSQLYAKVQELGLEKGVEGKYKKATNAKLMALLAASQGWKPENPKDLKGLNPFINIPELKEIKSFISKIDFPTKEQVAAIELETKEKKKAAELETKEKNKAEAAVKKDEWKLKKELWALQAKAHVLGMIGFYGIQDPVKLQAEIDKYVKEIGSTATYNNPAVKPQPFKITSPTPQQKKALKYYTDGGYDAINRILREGNNGLSKKEAEALTETVHYLDEILDNGAFKKPMYRGISVNVMNALKAQTSGFKEGTVISDAGYGSFSSSESFAKGWKPILIRAAGGGKGCVDISSQSEHKHEKEVLVTRGMQMKIKKWNPDTNTLDVELIGAVKTKIGTKDGESEGMPDLGDFTELGGLWDLDIGEQTPLQERWSIDEEDPNFFTVRA